MDRSTELLLEQILDSQNNMHDAQIAMQADLKELLAEKNQTQGKRTLVNVVVSSVWAILATLITQYFGAPKA